MACVFYLYAKREAMTNEKNGDNNPSKVYREELDRKGGDLLDSEQESKARDRAKIDRVQSGEGQKMDSSDLSDDRTYGTLDADDEIEQKG